MSASLPQRNDILLLGLPSGKRDIGRAEAGKEYMRAIAAPQGRSAKVVGNDKVSVDIFDFGRALDKYSRVQVSPHSFPLPRSNPERVWNEREKLNQSNPVTAVIDGLSTAMRRAEEPTFRCRSETTQPVAEAA